MTTGHRFIHLALGALAIGVPAEAHAGRNLGTVLGEINRSFICPEFQPDDDARRADLLSFSRALASVGPRRITYREAAYIRAKMLVRHNCTGSTGAVASALPATEVAAAAP